MLSNMRIGKKLFVGFGLLIVLLLLVGGVGWTALRWVDQSNQGTEAQINVFTQSNNAVMASYEAQLASNSHSMSKDPAYNEKVKEWVGKVTTACDEAKTFMVRQDMKDKADGIAEDATNFLKLDTEYKGLVEAMNAAKKRSTDCYDAVDKAVSALQTRINKTSGDLAAAADKGEEKLDGTTLLGRMKAIEAAGKMLEMSERIQFRAVQFELAVTDEAQEKFHNEMMEAFKYVEDTIPELKTVLTHPDCHKLLDGVATSMKSWKDTIKPLEDSVNALEDNQKAQDALAIECGEGIVDVITGVTTNIQAESASTASLIRNVNWVILGVGLVSVLIGILFGWMTAKNITVGMGIAVNALNRMAQDGDLTVEVPAEYMRRKDELGDLSHSLTATINEFRSVENMAKELAGGNWLTTVKVRGDLDAMNINLNAMLDQVNAALGNTAEAVEQVATGASQVASASESLSQGATESAASIEEITASMQEIGAQTNSNAQNANEANKLAQGANDSAAQGQNMMKQMINSMEAITKNSQDIQKVVKVIDDISFQTNLLALNAAVEAARAGVHGKGFAVVAEEVRNLASRSAKAAAETTQMIDNNSRQINEGAGIAQQTAEMLDGIVEQSQQVANLLKEIANASSEQAQGVSQVSQGLHQIDAVTQQNTANAEETASVSNEMSSQASELQKLIGQFRIRRLGASKPVAAPVAPKTAAPTPTPTPAAPKAAAPKPAAPKAAAPKPTAKADPSAAVQGDAWGGGGQNEVHIDLGDLNDKNFGKY